MKYLDKPWVIPMFWILFTGYLVHPLVFSSRSLVVSGSSGSQFFNRPASVLPEKYRDIKSLRDPFLSPKTKAASTADRDPTRNRNLGPWQGERVWGLEPLSVMASRLSPWFLSQIVISDLPPILTATRREKGEPLDVKGVISTGGQRLVFMGNQILAEGDSVGEYVLRSIENDRIVLVKDGGRTVLIRPLRFTDLPTGNRTDSGKSSR